MLSGAADIVELLIQHKAAVNALDINKESPLHWAVAYGMTFVRILLVNVHFEY